MKYIKNKIKYFIFIITLLPGFAFAETLLFSQDNTGTDYNNIGTYCVAQTWTADNNADLTALSFYIARTSEASWTYKIVSTTGGVPDDNTLITKTVSDPGGTNQWLKVTFDSTLSITNGTTYGLVVSQDSTGGIWNYQNGDIFTGSDYRQANCSGSFVSWNGDDFPVRIYGNVTGGGSPVATTSTSTTASTTIQMLGGIMFGQGILVVLMFLMAIGFMFNNVTNKKQVWQS